MGHDHNHDHNHNHGGCCDEGHSHELDQPAGEKYTLYLQVDVDHVRVLNSESSNCGQALFKPWAERFNEDPSVESDADEELIVCIPFTDNVKLKAIAVLGGPGDQTPSEMSAYANRDDIDFASAGDVVPDQEWELVPPQGKNSEIAEYRTKVARFSSLRTLTLHFKANYGAGTTRITYIGLEGEYSAFTRDPVITTYEAAANPSDHKTKATTGSSSMIQ